MEYVASGFNRTSFSLYVVSGFSRTRGRMKRTRLIILVATLIAAAGVLSAQAPAGPIRIGFIVPLSGPYAQSGRDILNGFLLCLDEIGYRAGGREIQLIVEDDEAIPAVTLTKARKLVESDDVHLMAGTLLSSSGYALAPYIDAQQIPMVYPVVSADDLTQRRRSRWIVRTGWTGSQPNHAFGEYAYHTLGYRRIATIALDYAFGWESVGGFQRTFEAEGGRITQKMWTPVSVHDFAPYLAQISRDVDAVYALFLGRAALQFMRQYQEYGLKTRVPLIGSGTTTDEHVLPFMGDEAIGVVTSLHYSAAIDSPANRKFAAAVPLSVREGAELLLRKHVHGRQMGDCRHRGARWPRGGPREAARRAARGQADGTAEGPCGAGRVWQPD